MPDVPQSDSKAQAAPVVTVHLPTAFHVLTGGRKKVSGEGDTVREVLAGLERTFPGMTDRLMDAEGAMKRYVNVYRNDSDIRGLDGLDTKLTDDDVLWIIPAVAGGSGAARTGETR